MIDRLYTLVSMKKRVAFTLIELMIVVAIIAFLATMAVPNLLKFSAKAKRAEAYAQLRSLYMAEKVYFAEKGSYTTLLTGNNSLGWKPDGTVLYTYGFSGTPGVNNIIGSLGAQPTALDGSRADKKSFLAYAVGDLDGDGVLDKLSITETGEITIVTDDLS